MSPGLSRVAETLGNNVRRRESSAGGTRPARSAERAALALGVLSLSPTLGVVVTYVSRASPALDHSIPPSGYTSVSRPRTKETLFPQHLHPTLRACLDEPKLHEPRAGLARILQPSQVTGYTNPECGASRASLTYEGVGDVGPVDAALQLQLVVGLDVEEQVLVEADPSNQVCPVGTFQGAAAVDVLGVGKGRGC